MDAERTLIERLEAWGRTATARLSPMVGERAASILVESTMSEAIGPWVDERLGQSSRTAASGHPPSYSEITEFFQRFSPEVVLSLPRGSGGPPDLARMIEIRNSVCAKIVSELPVTLGAYGRGILAVDWRAIVEELPERTEAMHRLAATPGGNQLRKSLRAEVDDLIAGLGEALTSAETWLRVRFGVIERLRRLRPAGRGPRD